MIPRRAWLRSKNNRARSAVDVARLEGHLAIATLIARTIDEVYSQEFVDLQVGHVLHGKCSGGAASMSLSSLGWQMVSIRAFFPGINPQYCDLL